MMERLLQLKEPVVEYFGRNSNDKRRLTSHDWNVTNQVCSILDPIAEMNIKIQGAEDAYISQATFLMKKLMEIMISECLQIRVPDKPGMDPVQYEEVNKSELFPEVEMAVEVYREVMEEKDLDALPDWRWTWGKFTWRTRGRGTTCDTPRRPSTGTS
ncbi:unnamed protein product [Ascophyllum nodosum]